MSFLCPFNIGINLLKQLRNVLMSVCLQKDELEQEAPYSAYLVAWIGGLGCDAVRWWCVRNPVRWSPVEGTVVEIPLFYKVFVHPNGGWPWECFHEQYVKICPHFCGADFSWWSGDNHGAMVTCADTYLAPLKLLRNPAEPCISRKHCFGAREDWIHSILFGIKIHLSMNISVLVCIYT